MGSVMEIYNSPLTYRVNRAEWRANNKIRAARNEREAAGATLQNYMRTVASKRRVEAAAEEYNAVVGNLAASLDQSINTDMNLVLAAAQTQGSLAAQAGAAGVSGSSVELINSVTELQRNMAQQDARDERDRANINTMKGAARGMDNAFQAIDNSMTFGNFDRTIQIEPQKLKNRWGAMIAVAAATYFGGPQAGQAAADTILANHKYANGKFAEGNQYMTNAAQNAIGAAKEWSSLQDADGKSKSWFQSVRDTNLRSRDKLEKAQARSSQGFSSGFFNWS